jgi:cysteine synthase
LKSEEVEQHPDWWISRHRNGRGYYCKCFDYSVKEVRDRILGYINEQLEKYDVYGLELDFTREAYCFPYGKPDREIMLSFMRDVKAITTRIGNSRNKQIKVAILCQPDPMNAYHNGFDIVKMAEEGLVDVVIASVGTSGTLTGVAQALKTSNPDLYVVAVEPKNSNVLNGGKSGAHKIHGIGAGFIPPLYKSELVDEVFDVSDDDAWDMAKLVAQTEGMPVGISSGAALVAGVDVSWRDEFKDKNIVVILPDSILNYISEL